VATNLLFVRRLAMAAAAATAFALLYHHVVVKLVHDWATDDNYSHGFFIVPLAAYLAWERREKLRVLEPDPSNAGLIVVIASLGAMVAGTIGAELFLTRISMIGVCAGAVLFLGGRQHLRVLLFPLLFLLLMIPIPSIVFTRIAFPLQLLASQFGTTVMSAAGIPVLREGNVLVLSNMSLEVAEACSGIRSLVSLLTLGIVIGYFADRRSWARVTIALTTIPIAIVTNGLRVAGTGIAARYYGSAAAEGFFHSFSGWLVFLAALALLAGAQRGIARLAPERRAAGAPMTMPVLQAELQ
jgi:exosortase